MGALWSARKRTCSPFGSVQLLTSSLGATTEAAVAGAAFAGLALAGPALAGPALAGPALAGSALAGSARAGADSQKVANAASAAASAPTGTTKVRRRLTARATMTHCRRDVGRD